MTLTEEIEQVKKDILIMDKLCSAATSDSASRIYETRKSEFVAKLVELKKRQSKGEK